VPVALAGATLAKSAGITPAAGSGPWLAGAVQAAAAHPLAAAVLAVGVTVPVAGWAIAPAPGRSGPATAPSVATGALSLESAAAPGRYVSVFGEDGTLEPVSPASAADDRRRATLRAVRGLADPACLSFLGPDGRYLRHASFRLQPGSDDGTVLFRGDATFCARPGASAGSVSLESFNYRGFFLRRVDDQLRIDQSDGSASFRSDSSFRARRPLG
ncbi:AbfB domain-containing protein, partial [Nocardia aurantiaca]